MSSHNFVGPIKGTKSRKGHGRRAANYGARPKAGKPTKAAMYLKSLRLHDKGNFSAQFTSHMGIIGRNAAHLLMALEVVKVEAWTRRTVKSNSELTFKERSDSRKARKAAAYRASQA